jgi:hypothetical protein
MGADGKICFGTPYLGKEAALIATSRQAVFIFD